MPPGRRSFCPLALGSPIPRPYAASVIHAGVGYSDEFSAGPAARQAVARARESLGAHAPGSALVFATAAWGPGLPGLLEAIRSQLGDCTIFGASVAGLFAAGQGTAANPGVAVALLYGLEVEGVLLEDFAADQPDCGAEIIDHFTRPPGVGDLLLLLVDLRHQSPDSLLDSLAKQLDAGLVVGVAASAPPGGDASVWCDDQVASAAAVGVVLRGAAATHWGVAQGCRILSEPLTVSRSRDRWISSFDGRPALDILRELAERAHLPASAESLRQLMVEIDCAPNGSNSGCDCGGKLLRNIVGIDPRRSAILLPEAVPPGARVRFALRDAVAARENLEALVAQQVGPGCALGLYLSGSSLDYAGADGAARDARCFSSHDPNFPVLGVRGAQLLGPAGDVGTHCAALNDCGLLVVVER
jgi:small ligand-binding sensory domain FIST